MCLPDGSQDGDMAIERFIKDENGATAIEYGLIIAVLSLAAVAGFGYFADALEYLFGHPESAIQKSLQTGN
jgi:pilus assembly protein Flp/PilA